MSTLRIFAFVVSPVVRMRVKRLFLLAGRVAVVTMVVPPLVIPVIVRVLCSLFLILSILMVMFPRPLRLRALSGSLRLMVLRVFAVRRLLMLSL